MLDDYIHSSAPTCTNATYAVHEYCTVRPGIYTDIIMRFMVEVNNVIKALDKMECPQALLEPTLFPTSPPAGT